jgi:hypothetical protein
MNHGQKTHSFYCSHSDAQDHVLKFSNGKAEDHRYLDHWVDDHTFHWQSQNSTSPTNKRGRQLIEEQKLGTTLVTPIHLPGNPEFINWCRCRHSKKSI